MSYEHGLTLLESEIHEIMFKCDRVRAKQPMNNAVQKYLASIGARGGKVKSAAKTEAARRNAKLPRKKKNTPERKI